MPIISSNRERTERIELHASFPNREEKSCLIGEAPQELTPVLRSLEGFRRESARVVAGARQIAESHSILAGSSNGFAHGSLENSGVPHRDYEVQREPDQCKSRARECGSHADNRDDLPERQASDRNAQA